MSVKIYDVTNEKAMKYYLAKMGKIFMDKKTFINKLTYFIPRSVS